MKTYGTPGFYDNGACSLTCLPILILLHPTQTSQIDCLSICLPTCLSACLHACLCFCLSIFIQAKSHGCLKYKLDVFKQTFWPTDKNNLAKTWSLVNGYVSTMI